MSFCILTGSSALFPPITSSGGHLIRTLEANMDGQGVILPGMLEFSRTYRQLERDFSAILVLAASENILPGCEAARLAAQSHGGTTKISVIDSQQIGPGLGILAYMAAQEAAAGASMAAVEDSIRAIIPHIFTILYPDHPPLYQTSKNTRIPEPEQTDHQQVYLIEDGCLTPFKKVRTQRHLLESMHEFLEEFEKPRDIAFFLGSESTLRPRPLREMSNNIFPGIHFNELELNASLTAIFGMQTVGLTVLET
jgi:fatty acid-binding protein DegV